MSLSDLAETLVPYLELLAIISFIAFVISIILIPWYICRLSPDFFYTLQSQTQAAQGKRTHLGLLILRNCIGAVLIIAGFIMLFIPGQGILTILIGLLCMSFPGKHRLMLYLIGKPSIQSSLNWTRKKLRRKPFHWKA